LPDKPVSVEETRALVAHKLLKAIEVAEKLALKTGTEAKKGAGGVPPKARWYQLMAYLSQTLNGVLQNQDLNETKQQVAELMQRVAAVSKLAEKSREPNRKA
jgi:hypothetical protein